MSDNDETPQKLSFFGKAKLAVKEFFKGALSAAPMSLLYSGLAFGASAALGHYVGADFNFLKVDGLTEGVIGRLAGSVLIGSSISGVVQSVKAVIDSGSAAKDPAPDARPVAAAPAQAPGLYQSLTPPITPMGQTMHRNQHLRT